MASIALTFAVLSPREASAQVEPMRLDYQVSPGCPAAHAFLDEVFKRTARARLAAEEETARTFVVRITLSEGGAVGSLSIREQDRPTLARELSGEECADVASALALATALAIDPQASLAPADELTENSRTSEPRAASPQSPTRSTGRSSQADRGAERVSETRPGHGGGTWKWSAALGARAVSRIAPRPSFGGSALIQLSTSEPNALVSGFGVELVILSGPTSEVAGASSSFRFAFARPEVCGPRLEVFAQMAAMACTAVGLGVVTGSGSNIERPVTQNEFWATLDLLARLRFTTSGGFFVQVDGSALFPLTRYDFYFRDPDTRIFAVPAVAFAAGAAFGLEF